MEFIHSLEKKLGRASRQGSLPLQAGEVPAVFAQVEDLARDIGFSPATPIAAGILS